MRPDIFYDRQFKVWVLIWKDTEGNQVGGAEYFPSKQGAKQWAQSQAQRTASHERITGSMVKRGGFRVRVLLGTVFLLIVR